MHTLHLSLQDLKDYISWPYFFHAWSIPVHQQNSEEAVSLQADALKLLKRLSEKGYQAHFRFRLFRAYSQEDDIVLIDKDDTHVHIPFLRQQRTSENNVCLCLSDFVRPLKEEGELDSVGLFAATVDRDAVLQDQQDDYLYLLSQTLCDRIAEAASEYGHLEVRRHLWGYAPKENLPISELLKGHFQGIRPAVGYPCLPDQSLNFLLAELLDFPSLGITLTESAAMLPHASVSGLMFSHPLARYFEVGTIGKDQLQDYEKRRHWKAGSLKSFLRVENS